MPTTPTARWTARLKGTKALAIKQPWAWLILNGYKDIENRSRRTHHRGPLLIHAGLSRSDLGQSETIAEENEIDLPQDFVFGGIIGVVDVVDCVETHPSAWHIPGYFGWVLANPRRLKFRACTGALGLFRPVFE